jgi:hypothetical protein
LWISLSLAPRRMATCASVSIMWGVGSGDGCPPILLQGFPLSLDLSRFDAAPLIAFTAPKETEYGTETDG